jgi:hypothetical protein
VKGGRQFKSRKWRDEEKMSTLAFLLAVVASAPPISGGQRLSLQVSPAVALAPAFLTVRTTIEPSEDNRLLNIEVDSSSYHRSTEIPLDGKHSPRMNVFEIKRLPTGLYEVRAVLVGAAGPIASTMKLVKVEPAAGYSH